jgi:uncharacterized protein YggE
MRSDKMNVFQLKLTGTAAVTLAAGLFLTGWPQPVRGDDPLKYHTIAVTGKGKIAARPDIAEVTAGVVTHAPSAKDALSANNEAMSRLLEILKERGIAEKDIQTSHIEIAPQYSQPPPRVYPEPSQGAPQPPPAEFVPRLVGYSVSNTLRITSRRIDQLGPLLDAIVQGGANQIHGISFRVDQPEKLLDEARKRAMADARHTGALLAGEAGVILGPPLKIESQEDGGPVPPRFMGAHMAAPAARAASMAVVPGEQELAVTVSVIYALKLAKE